MMSHAKLHTKAAPANAAGLAIRTENLSKRHDSKFSLFNFWQRDIYA